MGYDRHDCWMTCGERDDKCADMGLMDGPFPKDPFAEIGRLRSALEGAIYSLCTDDYEKQQEKAAELRETLGAQ